MYPRARIARIQTLLDNANSLAEYLDRAKNQEEDLELIEEDLDEVLEIIEELLES